jgi:DNA polymerase bacteriophage-type
MGIYSPENLVFFDFETRSAAALKLGSYPYAVQADAILLSFAIGLGPVQLVDRRSAALHYTDLPDDLREAFEAGKIFCAWNTTFDRCIWNYSLRGSPFLAPAQVIDARATALAHNLPDDLQAASVRLGGPGKQADGKDLMGLFCGEHAFTADQKPEEWKRFCSYAVRDTDELRRVFRVMLPALGEYDWKAYQANEVVNDNGIAVDLGFCEQAARLAAEAAAAANAELSDITDGRIWSIHQNVEIAKYVHSRLPDAESRNIMATVFKEESDDEDDSALVEKTKLTIARGTVERLLDYLRKIDYADEVLMQVLELREYGASAAPKKFQAILDRHVDGRLHGEFIFNGAGQTGRFSGKGVQCQNLTRSVLGKDPGDDYGYWEEPTVAMIADGCSLSELSEFGNGEVPARKLALTIRPALIASGSRTLVKADYSQIEARVLPWLSKSKGGDKLLDSFRLSDVDPNAPDLYRVSAGGMINKLPLEISKEERQMGKIAVLACGFGGGRNALLSMAAQYRMHFTADEAQKIVEAWRQANQWAPAFWGKHNRDESYGLFGAARRAMAQPQTLFKAGRIGFVFVPLNRDGMLICILPSGRPLIYPSCRMRDYHIIDKLTKQVKETRHGLTFRRARGIIALYGGRFAENVTQAAAADLLREAIVRLVEQGFRVVAHSHDEIVVECERSDVARVEAAMHEAMTFDRPWAEGLPLSIDVTTRWYYSACKQMPLAKLAA